MGLEQNYSRLKEGKKTPRCQDAFLTVIAGAKEGEKGPKNRISGKKRYIIFGRCKRQKGIEGRGGATVPQRKLG